MRPRRIVVNTAIYLHGTSGSATATRSLVGALRGVADSELQEVSPRPRGRSRVLNAVRDSTWDLWRAARIAPGADLHVSPCNIGFGGSAGKHLLVIYDVMVFDRPDLFDRRFASFFRLLVPPSARRADCVITMSEHAARTIRAFAPETEVRVIGWPYPDRERPRVERTAMPTVLMVGATEPVKNQVAGVEVVARLRRRTGSDVRLRVIGPAGRAEPAVRAALATWDPGGQWSSREVGLTDQQLDATYASAWILLQPSIDEGFGLPLVEALRHGTPAVHSGRGPMSEILPSGDAGGTSAEQLATAAAPLLDSETWSRASSAATDHAAAFRPDVFRRAIRCVVGELLADS